MLKHSRVSGTLDVVRLGNAIARPGIDPRRWASFAVVQAVTVDPDHGVIADVLLLPSGQQGTARLGAEYAGPRYGFYTPLGFDDEVLVETPDGNPGNGYVITRRLHSPSDPPPQEVVDNPDDVVLVVKPGQSVRLVVSEGGQVVIGAETATDQAVLGTTYRAAEDQRFAAMDALASALATMTAALAAAAPVLTGTAPQISAFTAAVTAVAEAATALGTAATTFSAGAYLSQVVAVAK